MKEFLPTIGLEVHVGLKTRTKMFCNCLNEPGEHHPNVNVCPICMGHPGVLPVINQEAVKKLIQVGLALNGTIAKVTKWDRKNYFYPDLPKGYQISQYDQPIVTGGHLEIEGKRVHIRRVHLEEDAGRLQHVGASTLVDFNRAGTPLMELVTEPEITSGEEARAFAEELQRIFRYLDASDADMEKGLMRVEVNISLRQVTSDKKQVTGDKRQEALGTKVEIKNLNSFRTVERAIDFEIKRQSKILASGKNVVQETRGWDEGKEQTVSQRTKEEAHDYRYFPEPDLPPLALDTAHGFDLEALECSIPELPKAKRERFLREYGLPPSDIVVLTSDRAFADYFESVISELKAWDETRHNVSLSEEHWKDLYKLTANYLISDLQGLLIATGTPLFELKIDPENFAELIMMIHQGDLSSRAAKDVLKEMFETGKDPSQVIEERGVKQVSGEAEIEAFVDIAITENPKAADDYKQGKENALQFLVGRAIAASKGKANPAVVREILKKKLL